MTVDMSPDKFVDPNLPKADLLVLQCLLKDIDDADVAHIATSGTHDEEKCTSTGSSDSEGVEGSEKNQNHLRPQRTDKKSTILMQQCCR